MEHKSKLPDHRPLLKEEKIGDDEEAYFANDMPCRKYKLVTLLWPKNQHLVKGIVRKSKFKTLLKLNQEYEFKGERLHLKEVLVDETGHHETTLYGKNLQDYELIDWSDYLPYLTLEEALKQKVLHEKYLEDLTNVLVRLWEIPATRKIVMSHFSKV